MEIALVDIYVKIGSRLDAFQVFDNMPKVDIISFPIFELKYSLDAFGDNALITMYSKCGKISIAFQVFG